MAIYTYFATLVGTNLYIGSGSLTNLPVLDTTTNTVIDNITVGSCPTASTLVVTDLYVNNECDGTISVIDTTTNTVTDTISVGSSPHVSVLVGMDLYVINYTSTDVSVINTTTNTVTDTITVGNNPYHLISTGTHVYVANNNSNSVSVIDTTTKTIVVVPPPLLLSAEIIGDTITLTYDKALDAGSYPAITDFVVSVNSQSQSITDGGIIIIGSTIILTLDTPVEFGDTVTVDYLVGDNPIQDIFGYSGSSINSQSVTNNTPVTAPTVSTGSVISTSETMAVLQGNIVSIGGSNPTGRGIHYGTTTMYGLYSPSDSGSFSTGIFSEEITNLYCGTLYHYRAYATNIAGTDYGDDETFTTISCENGGGGGGGDPTPTIVNTSATNITKTSATLGANITDDLGGPITSRGMFYILTSHLIDGSPDDFANLHTTALDTTPGEGEFTENISGLDCGVEYVYVGYASIEPGATNPLEGAHFGSAGISTFTTLPCSSSGGSTVILIPSTPVSLNNGNLSFTSSTGSGSQIVGCVGSNMYSPITGQKCPVSNINQPYQFTRSLRFGSVGEDVRKLQEFLNSNGTVVSASGPGSPGNEIKTFGKKTMLALTKYQKANNITPASGFFGLKTMKLVNQILLEGK